MKLKYNTINNERKQHKKLKLHDKEIMNDYDPKSFL